MQIKDIEKLMMYQYKIIIVTNVYCQKVGSS